MRNGVSSKLWAKLGTRTGMSLVPSHRSPFSDKSTSYRSHSQILPKDYVIIMVWASKFEVTLPRAPLKSNDSFGFEALPITCTSARCHLFWKPLPPRSSTMDVTGGTACRPLQKASQSLFQTANYS